MRLPRDLCTAFSVSSNREWLVTNGLGSFACGTVCDALTRRYHGLFVPALAPPLGRRLLWVKADATVTTQAGAVYDLAANVWHDGTVDPRGYVQLLSFALEGTTPVWTYALGDAIFERRVFFAPGAQAVYLSFAVVESPAPLRVDVRIFADDRDYHGDTRSFPVDGVAEVDGTSARICIANGTPWYLTSDRGTLRAAGEWYYGYYLARESERGLDCIEDHVHAVSVQASLERGESLALAGSLEPNPPGAGAALEARRAHEAALLRQRARVAPSTEDGAAQRLSLAADQFIVRRATARVPDGTSVIAGYPWFGDWGRDAMIALPGLTLQTGRCADARSILETFARFIDRGMLPNRFPDSNESPDYNTVDAALWFAVALDRYVRASEDSAFGVAMLPHLRDIVEWYVRGTRYGIVADPADGLVRAGEAGVQLTWMDAKAGDRVITARIGKPVEVNALWYNLLRVTANVERAASGDPAPYERRASQAAASFQKFWNADAAYAYDVIDGPEGNDASIRPNAVIALSLPYPLLTQKQQQAVVDRAAAELWTPAGLRSLAPGEPGYRPQYLGNPADRDAAYHNGTVWPYLIGAFVTAHLRAHGDARRTQAYLQPCVDMLYAGAVGTVHEIADASYPNTPHGCFAQAWSVGELLRALDELSHYRLTPP